ncbi:hypothetical protein ACNKHL_23290 [Shigella flexneri]
MFVVLFIVLIVGMGLLIEWRTIQFRCLTLVAVTYNFANLVIRGDKNLMRAVPDWKNLTKSLRAVMPAGGAGYGGR